MERRRCWRWIRPAVVVSLGEVPGIYHVEVAPAAVSDPEGVTEIRLAEVRLQDGLSVASVPWSPETGARITWLGVPGQELELVAVDDRPALRRTDRVRLAPLPGHDGLLPESARPVGRQPRLVAGGAYLLAGYEDRLDLVDPASGEIRSVTLGGAGQLLDLAADASEAVLLVRRVEEDGQAELRLARVALGGALEEAVLSETSGFAIPDDVFTRWSVELLPDSVRVIGRDAADGTPDAALVFPNTWPGEALTATPDVQRLP